MSSTLSGTVCSQDLGAQYHLQSTHPQEQPACSELLPKPGYLLHRERCSQGWDHKVIPRHEWGHPWVVTWVKKYYKMLTTFNSTNLPLLSQPIPARKKIFVPKHPSFIYFWILFLAVLGLCCYMWAFSSCSKWGLLSSCAEQASHCSGLSFHRAWGPEHAGFRSCSAGLSSCGTWA